MNADDDCLGREGKGDAEAPATPAGPSKLPLSYDDVPLPLAKWTDSFAILATLTLVGFLLVYLKGILMPFVVALFLVYLVRPLANTISSCRCRRRAPPEEGEAATGPERASLLHASTDPKLMLRDMETRLPRWAGVFLALLFAISVMVAFALAITLTLTSFEQSIPGYRESAQREWTQLLSWLKAKLNLELPELQALPSRLFSSLAGSILSSSMGIVSDGNAAPPPAQFGAILRAPRSLAAPPLAGALIIIFLAFMLLEAPAPTSSLRKKIDDAVSRYLVLKSLISVSVAFAVYLTLAIASFPLALLIALLTLVLNFIPNVGPAVAFLLPIPIILLDPDVKPKQAWVAMVVPGLLHLTVGNVLEPLLFGRQFSMKPLVILLSLGIWWIVWGPVGAVLAVPLTSSLRIVTQHFVESGVGRPYMDFLAALLEGRTMSLRTGATPRPEARAEKKT